MKNEEINEAIEAALGNTVVDGRRVALWPHPRTGEPEIKHESAIPDYANSLDACAGFERTLDRIQRREYVRGLYDITANDFEAHCATSLQRCEAYLRMKGLWNERHDKKQNG